MIISFNFKHNFNFTLPGMDHVFGGDADTDAVYDASFRHIVQNCCDGLNGCILAYGQTSSGKTYSMLGDMQKTVAQADN